MSGRDALVPMPPVSLRLFPRAVEIEGKVTKPVIFWFTDDRSEVWGLGDDGNPRLLLSGPPFVSRERAPKPTGKLSDGTKLFELFTLADGTVWELGIAKQCCGCTRHPLCAFQPQSVETPA